MQLLFEAIMKCEYAEGCSVIKSTRLLELCGDIKKQYCDGSPEQCARYMLRSKGRNVPVLLMPNGYTCRRSKKSKTGIELVVE